MRKTFRPCSWLRRKLHICHGGAEDDSVNGSDGRGSGMFQKLTPTDEVSDETMDGYDRAIDFVFDEKNADIHNVAITGPYGSGKSSMLETYKRTHKDRKFYHVYLARFTDPNGLQECGEPVAGERAGTDDDKKTPADSGRGHPENTVEGKMLNQLIQQIPRRKIPYTNFKVKRDRRVVTRLLISLSIAAVVIGIILLVWGTPWEKWVNGQSEFVKSLLGFTLKPWFDPLLVVVVSVILFFWLFRAVSVLWNRNVFRRISVKGSELEIFSSSDDSYFDRYLNEILYLFDRMGDVNVVFEDLDRFDDERIYVRLREINRLINTRGRKRLRRPVRFFYLMRDEIFPMGDRTKFFDYIIPVVPFVDGSNSYRILREYLRGAGVGEDAVNSRFLKNTCLYVDDIRVIKNVFNEFIVFRDGLKKNPDPCKLIAMLVYKNVFSRDYANLLHRKGLVFSALRAGLSPVGATEDVPGDENAGFSAMMNEMRESVRESDPVSYAEMADERSFDLLKYLLRNGYIDEKYSEYMVTSYPDGIRPDDEEFIRALNNLESKDSGYAIHNPEAVYDYIDEKAFSNPAVLNYDLVDYMAGSDKADSLGMVADQITEGRRFDFFASCFNRTERPDRLVALLNRVRPGFFSLMLESGGEDVSGILYPYSLCSLLVNSADELAEMDSYACGDGERRALSSYVSSRPEYLASDAVRGLDTRSKDTLAASLEALGVRFLNIDAGASDTYLLDAVRSKNLYERNGANLGMFMEMRHPGISSGDERARFLTLLRSEGDGGIYGYYKDDMGVALSYVLGIVGDGDYLCDDEETVVSILNDAGIGEDVRSVYAERNATVITDLSSIEGDAFYPALLRRGTVAHSTKNIVWYLERRGFTDELACFINSTEGELDFGGISDIDACRLLDGAMRSERLDNLKFAQIATGLNVLVCADGLHIPGDKLDILRQRGKVLE